MSKVVYFVLESYEEVIYLEVPRTVHREAWIYIHDHTEYTISAVADSFVEMPDEITPLREWLSHDLEWELKSFWRKLWVRESDFALDDFMALVRKRDWEAITRLVWELRKREIENGAPYRVYTISADAPSLSGNPPPGSEIIVDRKTAATLDEKQLGKEVPLEEILSGRYQVIRAMVADIGSLYNAGRRILDELSLLEGKSS